MTILTVGVDILDGSFEVDFSYAVLPQRVGEDTSLVRYTASFVRLRIAGEEAGVCTPVWLDQLIDTWLDSSGDVYLAVARAEGRDVS